MYIEVVYTVLVVQLTHMTMLYLSSMEPISNSAGSGGAVYAGTNTLLTFIGTSAFSNNSANWSGGAIYLKTNVVLTLSCYQ